MKNFNKSIGSTGEDIAAEFLIKDGYKILERNFNSRNGEIDIIGWDKDILCFIEVKTRYTSDYGSPIEAISITKANKIKKVCQFYILKNYLYDINIRFDVVEVYLNYQNTSSEINVVKDAFR
ncbi:YraN family protein [Clostridium manihotivorum]|uniref:UPF0102 protein C1I91_17140 n=1 Tax=Clostridium manihotivorum TaxID=2320868 RepID=A0A410DVQ6_9CLOT|nr:YraN family protein [Clostridium manihotivorum]QAA33226.1 YraN family protein [Clostridium manihotivorum]